MKELGAGSPARREELATAALATLNNVTFYREPPAPPDPLADTIDKLCKGSQPASQSLEHDPSRGRMGGLAPFAEKFRILLNTFDSYPTGDLLTS